jgi:hypothetical protein
MFDTRNELMCATVEEMAEWLVCNLKHYIRKEKNAFFPVIWVVRYDTLPEGIEREISMWKEKSKDRFMKSIAVALETSLPKLETEEIYLKCVYYLVKLAMHFREVSSQRKLLYYLNSGEYNFQKFFESVGEEFSLFDVFIEYFLEVPSESYTLKLWELLDELFEKWEKIGESQGQMKVALARIFKLFALGTKSTVLCRDKMVMNVTKFLRRVNNLLYESEEQEFERNLKYIFFRYPIMMASHFNKLEVEDIIEISRDVMKNDIENFLQEKDLLKQRLEVILNEVEEDPYTRVSIAGQFGRSSWLAGVIMKSYREYREIMERYLPESSAKTEKAVPIEGLTSTPNIQPEKRAA